MNTLPKPTKVFLFSCASIDSRDVAGAISALCKKYSAIDPSLFQGISVTTQTIVKTSDGGGYLPRQSLSTITPELPGMGGDGAIIDFYILGSKGRGVDQLIVFWNAESASRVLDSIPDAVRLPTGKPKKDETKGSWFSRIFSKKK